MNPSKPFRSDFQTFAERSLGFQTVKFVIFFIQIKRLPKSKFLSRIENDYGNLFARKKMFIFLG
ncbi:MAG: hypothetical protein EAZ89_11635 [Bacteroidetes bacterium]|nr:MAG: hypothetical protein EAZ89_11635 [Bacteroidota bacterium]